MRGWVFFLAGRRVGVEIVKLIDLLVSFFLSFRATPPTPSPSTRPSRTPSSWTLPTAVSRRSGPTASGVTTALDASSSMIRSEAEGEMDLKRLRLQCYICHS